MQNNAQVWKYADEAGVIVGRNGAVVLQDRRNALHVLLTGTIEDRVTRAAAEDGIPREVAAARQKREDDVRAEMSVVLYGWDPRLPDRYDPRAEHESHRPGGRCGRNRRRRPRRCLRPRRLRRTETSRLRSASRRT